MPLVPSAKQQFQKMDKHRYILEKGSKLKEFIKCEKRYISDKFPTKKFVEEQKRRYSKMKVWYSEDDCVEYSNNREPDRFMVHPKVLIEEKSKLETRLAEINEHLNFVLRGK